MFEGIYLNGVNLTSCKLICYKINQDDSPGITANPKFGNMTANKSSLRMLLTLQVRGIAKSVAVFCAAFGFCICFKPKNLATLGAPPE